MTDIELFMSQKQMYRCHRLSASITKATCQTNKTSGRVLSCSGCPGLGEEIEMGVKNYRGICPLCKRDDVLLISKNGECHRCYKRRDSNLAPTATVRPMPAAPEKKEKPLVVSPGLKLTKEDISDIIGDPNSVNLIELFKQRQLAELDLFICELQKQPTPYEKLSYAYHRICKEQSCSIQ